MFITWCLRQEGMVIFMVLKAASMLRGVLVGTRFS